MIITPSTSENGSGSAHLPGAPDGQQLQSVYMPTDTAAGGIFKIVEKDTGRVIVELPFQPPPAVDGSPAPDHTIDVQV